MREELSRTELLIGAEGVERLRNARVIVFGVGGVGGFAVEALARSGVGAIDLVDNDVICASNINRQIIATHSCVGRPKVDAAEERILDINPECRVTKHRVFYLPETAELFDFTGYDYIMDAIDTVSGKLMLVSEAKRAGVPIISAMGAGNKLDPTAFRVADIYETRVCPLARIMRKELKKRGVESLKVVYSEEPPISHEPSGEESSRRAIPGSVAFVPSVMGLILAGEVIKDLALKKL